VWIVAPPPATIRVCWAAQCRLLSGRAFHRRAGGFTVLTSHLAEEFDATVGSDIRIPCRAPGLRSFYHSRVLDSGFSDGATWETAMSHDSMKQITIDSRERWNDTGVDVVYDVTVLGQWNDGGHLCGPEGRPGGTIMNRFT
jgi:hypothetical protein